MKALQTLFMALLLVAVASPVMAGEVDAEAKAAAMAALRKEPTIKRLRWNEGSSTLRDGYAEYVCLVLREHGASTGMQVRVMDVRNPESWGSLGQAFCPDSVSKEARESDRAASSALLNVEGIVEVTGKGDGVYDLTVDPEPDDLAALRKALCKAVSPTSTRSH